MQDRDILAERLCLTEVSVFKKKGSFLKKTTGLAVFCSSLQIMIKPLI